MPTHPRGLKQLQPVLRQADGVLPLTNLIEAGIREKIVSFHPADLPRFRDLLGDDGERFWSAPGYREQPRPEGYCTGLSDRREFCGNGARGAADS